MPTAPSVLGRVIQFAPFDPTGVPTALADLVTYSRERALNVVVGLPAKRQAVLADADLDDEAKQRRLGQHLSASGIDLAATSMTHARRRRSTATTRTAR